jgi:hypothetical protein
MFMMFRVLHAFVATAAAHFRAEREQRPANAFIGARLP